MKTIPLDEVDTPTVEEYKRWSEEELEHISKDKLSEIYDEYCGFLKSVKY